MALLNSATLTKIYQQITVPKAGGHFIRKPMFLRELPIWIPRLSDDVGLRKRSVAPAIDHIRAGRFNDLNHLVKEAVVVYRNSKDKRAVDMEIAGSFVHDVLTVLSKTAHSLSVNITSEGPPSAMVVREPSEAVETTILRTSIKPKKAWGTEPTEGRTEKNLETITNIDDAIERAVSEIYSSHSD
jgi:hypothetical protein